MAMPEDEEWKLFHRPNDAWQSMYADCSAATHSIEFEQYMLENDDLGKRFIQLFIDKARQGIKVFIICDMFGSIFLLRSQLVSELRRQGGIVYFYNTLYIWKLLLPWLWFPRTHVKTLLIDSRIGYTGGVCMAEKMRYWRDTHIRLTGPVVQQMRKSFDDMEKRLNRRYVKRTRRIPRSLHFAYFLSRPAQRQLQVYEEISRAVDEAREYIYITSAYFMPPKPFIANLQRAAARNVDVRILVPARSDVLAADYIFLSYAKKYLSAGLRIYQYQATVLHSKTAIIDDRWSTIGSTNFDVLSFVRNREGNVVSTDPVIIHELKKQFFCDLDESEELTLKRIPLWKTLVGRAARLLRVAL